MSVPVWSHPLYRRYNKNSIYDIISTVYMAQYALYMTYHPPFMTSQHSSNNIKDILSHLTVIYLTAHPLYLCHHTQIINHTTVIVCIITHPQYLWHHMHYIWHHIHSLWYHSTLWQHTHCIHVITLRIPIITSNVAGPLFIVYWLYHTSYMCEMKTTICMISQEFYMTSHSLFMT